MEISEQLPEQEIEGSPDLFIDYSLRKSKISARRKAKFRDKKDYRRRKHWANHAGTFRDEEFRKGPKYWNGPKPVLVVNKIKSYQDLATAINLIAARERDCHQYKGVSGIDRERLKLAQSWRDKAIPYEISDIVCLSLHQIKRELGYRRPMFGRVRRN